jgi:hypothetical protein
LSDEEFKKTFKEPMQQLGPEAPAPFEFNGYFEQIPKEDFQDFDCSEGIVNMAYENGDASFQHVLVSSKTNNVFMVLVLDLTQSKILGHRLLDFNSIHGKKD